MCDDDNQGPYRAAKGCRPPGSYALTLFWSALMCVLTLLWRVQTRGRPPPLHPRNGVSILCSWAWRIQTLCVKLIDLRFFYCKVLKRLLCSINLCIIKKNQLGIYTLSARDLYFEKKKHSLSSFGHNGFQLLYLTQAYTDKIKLTQIKCEVIKNSSQGTCEGREIPNDFRFKVLHVTSPEPKRKHEGMPEYSEATPLSGNLIILTYNL